MGQAVDEVRRKENKALQTKGDKQLVGTRYDWLRNPTTMDPQDRRAFATLRDSNLKTARAWALKETAMSLYDYIYERPARKHFQWWHGYQSREEPPAHLAELQPGDQPCGPRIPAAQQNDGRLADGANGMITLYQSKTPSATRDSQPARRQPSVRSGPPETPGPPVRY